MSKKQRQLATYFKLFRKISDRKEQKLRMNLVDLTLFRPDFEELIQLLQNHLQDVEIFIDDQRILERAQLTQFAENYQARTLRARGYWSGRTGEQNEEPEARLLVELTITKLTAILSSWKSIEKSEFIVQLKKLLLRRVTPIQKMIQVFLFFSFLSPAYSAMTRILQQPFDSTLHILQSSLECIVGILAVPVFILLFMRLLLWMRLDTRNLLFPGKTTGTWAYQRTAMIIRVLIAIVLLFLFDGFLIIGSTLLAHFWR